MMTDDNGRRALMRSVVAVAIAAIAVCFFACTRTDEKPAASPEKVTIANIVPPFTVLVDIAQVKGYFKEEGLDVAMRKYPYGKIALQALMDGKADFAMAAETPIMFEILREGKIAIIATIQTSNRNAAIVAKKDRGIRAPGDLKGKTIGVTFDTFGEFFMGAFLTVNGISVKDVKTVDMTPDQMMAALATGSVDAVSIWTPHLIDFQKKLGERGITFYNEEIHTQTMNVVAKQGYIGRNPGIVRKILRALIRAEEFLKHSPREAQEIVAEYNRMDAGLLRDMWADNTFAVTLDQSLVLMLEDESLWATRSGLAGKMKVPNYLDFIYMDGLKSVKPEAVRILK